DGQTTRVESRELVPGDVLVLNEGDAVAADARLVSCANLKVTEASLTGESEPVIKQTSVLPPETGLADRVNMVYKGTAVVSGVARAVVVHTGLATEMGQIARLLEDRKSTRLNSSHVKISYAVFCLKKKSMDGKRAGCAPCPSQ